MLAPRTAMTPPAVGLERFAALWRRRVASPPSPDAAAVHGELCAHYAESFRRYHNLEHIEECLRRVDEVAPLLDDPDAVEFALWFHDVVYEVGASTNEWKSAELFLERASGAAPVFRRKVCGLVLATRHGGCVQGNDRRFIVDIDLSGIGAPWSEFVRNGERLRAESCALSDAQYTAGQRRFLRKLHERPQLYLTDYFRDRYENKARENIARALAELPGDMA